jgi:hypothetical protein
LKNKQATNENLKIFVQVKNTQIQYALSTKDEAYHLSITTQGEIRIESNTYVGYLRYKNHGIILRALNTLF